MFSLISELVEELRNIDNSLDIYTATDAQLLQAGRRMTGTRFLPQTSRSKSLSYQRWKKGVWKRAAYFSKSNPDHLYTLLIPLPQYSNLYSKEVAILSRNLMKMLPGTYFYFIEKGQKKGIHVHALLESENPPPKRLNFEGKYFQTLPRPFDMENDLTESVVRFVRYSLKVKNGEYRHPDTRDGVWTSEIREYLEGDRQTHLRLSGGTKLPKNLDWNEVQPTYEKICQEAEIKRRMRWGGQ